MNYESYKLYLIIHYNINLTMDNIEYILLIKYIKIQKQNFLSNKVKYFIKFTLKLIVIKNNNNKKKKRIKSNSLNKLDLSKNKYIQK